MTFQNLCAQQINRTSKLFDIIVFGGRRHLQSNKVKRIFYSKFIMFATGNLQILMRLFEKNLLIISYFSQNIEPFPSNHDFFFWINMKKAIFIEKCCSDPPSLLRTPFNVFYAAFALVNPCICMFNLGDIKWQFSKTMGIPLLIQMNSTPYRRVLYSVNT